MLEKLEIVAGISALYDEIRIAFDQYLPGSLKSDKPTLKTTPVYYHANINTEIMSLKVFLEHINAL